MTTSNSTPRPQITLGNLPGRNPIAALMTDELRQVLGGHLSFRPGFVRCAIGFVPHRGLYNLYGPFNILGRVGLFCRRGRIRFGTHSLLPIG